MKQLLVFGALSGVGTALHFAVLLVAVEWLELPALVGSTAGAVCGMLFNYWAHYHWTFAATTPHQRSLPLFVSGAVTSIALNALVMWLLLSARLNYVLAQILATGIVFAFNYVYAKHVAFRS